MKGKVLVISSYLLIFLVFLSLFTSTQIQAENESRLDWESISEAHQQRREQLKNNKESLDFIVAEYELAVAYANLGFIETSMEIFDRLGEEDAEEKLLEIIPVYEERYESETEDIENMNYLAFAYYINDDYELAKKMFEKLIKLDSENIWSYNYLAVVYHELEDYQQADNILQQSREIETNQYTHFLLGVNYYELGNYFRASYHIARGSSVARIFL